MGWCPGLARCPEPGRRDSGFQTQPASGSPGISPAALEGLSETQGVCRWKEPSSLGPKQAGAVSKTGMGRFGGVKTRDSCLQGRRRSACPGQENAFPHRRCNHHGAWSGGTSVKVPRLEQERGLGSSQGCPSAVPQIPAQNNTPPTQGPPTTTGSRSLSHGDSVVYVINKPWEVDLLVN